MYIYTPYVAYSSISFLGLYISDNKYDNHLRRKLTNVLHYITFVCKIKVKIRRQSTRVLSLFRGNPETTN
jgi:hypothetical protein